MVHLVNPNRIEEDILLTAVADVSLIGELDLVGVHRDGKSLGEWAQEVIEQVGENAQRSKSFKY